MREKTFSPFTVWERSGVTEHLGGVNATERLLAACRVAPGQVILNLGCGTGYTAVRLAQRHAVDVIASDINARLLQLTFDRARQAGVDKNVQRVQANAHDLPFVSGHLDGVIVESVLIFCQDASRVAAEMCRILKPGGLLGINEMTYLQPPPDDLRASLHDGLGIQPRTENEWQALFNAAGFSAVHSTLHHIKLMEQLMSHLKVDGLRNYLTAVFRNLNDAALLKPFMNKALMSQFTAYLGYGLYVCTK